MEGLDYAERLERLRMYSIQRRYERFKLIYIYKIKEGLVPNISSKYGLCFDKESRFGCLCKIPKFPPGGKARKARDNSFAWTAYNLWNSLPGCVRNIAERDVEFFKNKLDMVLTYYPDVPRCSRSGHSYDRNFHKSNSLCDHYKNERINCVINSITKESLRM